jgi:hypothetical protein
MIAAQAFGITEVKAASRVCSQMFEEIVSGNGGDRSSQAMGSAAAGIFVGCDRTLIGVRRCAS